MPDTYAAARAYIGIGWWPFAKKPNSKRPPPGSHDYLDARLDPTPWQREPGLNIALACGPSSLVVLDDDSADPAALALLGELLGEQALNTPIQITGGRGHHVFYQHPAGMSIGKLRLKELPGWEVLGEKANVLLTPSLHPSGRRYRWLGGHSPWRVRPLPLPPPLIEMILDQRQSAARGLPYFTFKAGWVGGDSTRYGTAMLRGCLAELPGTPEHSRNNKLNRVSYRLGRAIGGGLLTEQQVVGELIAAGKAMGLTISEVQHTVHSGMQAGARNPLHLASQWHRLERSRR